jgi:cyclase
MQRERVSDNVYWFQSEIYAQVTAGAITGPQWAVVIDTLALPEETAEMRDFLESELGIPVRYVINTHSHADHSWGNSFFPGATIISHLECRRLMMANGVKALENARNSNPAYKNTHLVFPNLTFDHGTLALRVGKKNLVMHCTPGHSVDGISVLVEEDRVLFTGDAFMPLPYIVTGDAEELAATIRRIGKMSLENIVQGHGDIILRGEIDEAVRNNLAYLAALKKAVKAAAKKRYPEEALEAIDLASCGKSRVLLGGLAPELHRRNVYFLFHQVSEDGGELEGTEEI